MDNNIVYSPKLKLPLFKATRDGAGERSIELKNVRTKHTETLRASALVVHLLNAEMANRENSGMLFSPIEKIPIGMLIRDESGMFYIEVKHKSKKEAIRFTTYVSLLLES